MIVLSSTGPASEDATGGKLGMILCWTRAGLHVRRHLPALPPPVRLPGRPPAGDDGRARVCLEGGGGSLSRSGRPCTCAATCPLYCRGAYQAALPQVTTGVRVCISRGEGLGSLPWSGRPCTCATTCPLHCQVLHVAGLMAHREMGGGGGCFGSLADWLTDSSFPLLSPFRAPLPRTFVRRATREWGGAQFQPSD